MFIFSVLDEEKFVKNLFNSVQCPQYIQNSSDITPRAGWYSFNLAKQFHNFTETWTTLLDLSNKYAMLLSYGTTSFQNTNSENQKLLLWVYKQRQQQKKNKKKTDKNKQNEIHKYQPTFPAFRGSYLRELSQVHLENVLKITLTIYFPKIIRE